MNTIGIAEVALRLARNATNTRRGLMLGTLVALAMITAISLYGALALALALNAWPAVVVEFVLVMGFARVLFTKPETVV